MNEIKDLRPDMILEGVVTNVAAFGAFVDIGVHQDGLVHISALADTFVKDPHTVVKVGQVVKVKVLEIDEKRKRIALTMRLTDAGAQGTPGAQGTQGGRAAKQEARAVPRSERAISPTSAAETETKKRGGAPYSHGGRIRKVEGSLTMRLKLVLGIITRIQHLVFAD